MFGIARLNNLARYIDAGPSFTLGDYEPAKLYLNPNSETTSAQDYFGWSVDISENYFIISAYQEDEAGVSNQSGVVYVYSLSDWSLIYTKVNPNNYSTNVGDQFGYTVAITDTHFAVSAHAEDDAGGTDSGVVYVYSTTTGNLLHTLTNPNSYGTSQSDGFGRVGLDISDNYLAVGVYQEDSAAGTTSGVVYVYNLSDGSLRHTIANANAYGTSAGDAFGITVAMNDDYLLIGAYAEDTALRTDSGVVYVYSPNSGSLIRTIQNPNTLSTATSSYFGCSIDLNDTYFIVGAYNDATNNSGQGRAYIFNLSSGSLVYTLENPNYNTSTGTNDGFGSSVALGADYACVGASGEDNLQNFDMGVAYIFDLSTGTQTQTLPYPNYYALSDNDGFTGQALAANALAMQGNNLIIGASAEEFSDMSTTNSGATWLYSRQSDKILGELSSISIVSDTYSTASTITIPSTIQAGDIAVLIDFSTTTTTVLPTGWSLIGNPSTTGIRTMSFYKRLLASDASTTITGMGGTTRKILLIIRGNRPLVGLQFFRSGQQATTSTPTNQNMFAVNEIRPIMLFAVYSSTGAIATRGWSVGSPTEYSNVSTSGVYVKTLTYLNSPANTTISMSDGGTNALITFWLAFQ